MVPENWHICVNKGITYLPTMQSISIVFLSNSAGGIESRQVRQINKALVGADL